ncbi:MAG: hypothetical protein ACOZNI_02760 [Myxococcota bacterium]
MRSGSGGSTSSSASCSRSARSRRSSSARSRRSGSALLLLFACAPECDLACKRDEALAAWRGDPSGTAGKVAAIADAEERAAVVLALAERFPGETRDLCQDLTEGMYRERCSRLNNRPHLRRAGEPKVREIPTRDAPGPATADLPRVAFGLVPAPPAGDPCGEAVDRATCLEHAAAQASVAGDAPAAAGICALASDTKARDECTFQAAEAGLQKRGTPGWPDAARLCGAAGQFAEACAGHVIARVVPHVTGADAMTEAVAAEAIAAADLVRETVAAADATAAPLWVDRFWAAWLSAAYAETGEVVGVPLALLPAEAVPHVHAAAARTWDMREHPDGPLSARVDALAAALADRAPRPPDAPRALHFVKVESIWAKDAPDERAIPTVYYLGGARRPVATDPRADLALCLLEAAARRASPDVALLKAAAADPTPEVAASAARLQRAIARGSERRRFTPRRDD